MNVKELIQELLEVDMSAEVFIAVGPFPSEKYACNYYCCPVRDVEIRGSKKEDTFSVDISYDPKTVPDDALHLKRE